MVFSCLEGLLGDAISKGARLLHGGELAGALMTPAVLDGVTDEMRIFHEEQFGPILPVARFADIGQVAVPPHRTPAHCTPAYRAPHPAHRTLCPTHRAPQPASAVRVARCACHTHRTTDECRDRCTLR